MTEVGGWRGGTRPVYTGLLLPLSVLAFGGSLLLGLGGSFRVWGAPPSIVFEPTALGEKLYEEGDLARAEREYRIAGLVYPSAIDTRAQLLAIYERAGDRDAIVRMQQQIVAMHPLEAQPILALGVALGSAGRYAESVETLEGLHRSAPQYPGIHEALGAAYLGADRLPEAEAVLRDGLRENPLSAGLHEHLAITLERLGRLEEAEREFERTHRIDPGRASARDNLRRLQASDSAP